MMTMTKGRLAALVALIVAADVITKVIAVRTLADDAIDLGIIHLRLIYNDGIAFGAGDSVPPMLLLTVVGFLTFALALAIWRGALPVGVATGFVLGGAIGNVADRAIGGTVVDIFDLGWWPAFNFADVCIVAGVVVLLLQGFREPGLLAPRSV